MYLRQCMLNGSHECIRGDKVSIVLIVGGKTTVKRNVLCMIPEESYTSYPLLLNCILTSQTNIHLSPDRHMATSPIPHSPVTNTLSIS